jgi:glycosyltransferase involved in cell wall biosynthesis
MDLSRTGIAFFLPNLAGGGAERVMLDIARGLLSKGYKVDLVLCSLDGPYISELPVGINLQNLNTTRIRNSFFKFYKYLKTNPDKPIVVTLQYANLFCLFFKKFLGVKNKIIIRESNAISRKFNKGKWRDRCFLKAIKFLYPSADSIIAVSNGIKKDLVKVLNMPPGKITVIPNPVFITSPQISDQGSGSHVRVEPGSPPVVLGVGRLEPQKDFTTLINAFALARKEIECRLIILGEGSLRERLVDLTERLGIDQFVDFPGFQIDPFSYMRKAKLFVLSSRWEGFPNVLIQALASGCSVVSTDCEYGPAEILDNGEYGHLIPVGDVEEMAKRIVLVLKNDTPKFPEKNWTKDYSLELITNMYIGVV